jgi:hypothetical protein
MRLQIYLLHTSRSRYVPIRVHAVLDECARVQGDHRHSKQCNSMHVKPVQVLRRRLHINKLNSDVCS